MNEELTQLHGYFNKIVKIPDDEWELFKSCLKIRKYQKKAYIIRADDIVDRIHFIVKGLVRFFYITLEGKEFNKYFMAESGVFGSYRSYLKNQSCGYYVQALEALKVIEIPAIEMQKSFDRHHCWDRLGRILAENLVLIKDEREKELLIDPLQLRYERFQIEHPELKNRISQYHIASYLGVTDSALSRLKKRLSKPE